MSKQPVHSGSLLHSSLNYSTFRIISKVSYNSNTYKTISKVFIEICFCGLKLIDVTSLHAVAIRGNGLLFGCLEY